jgi:phosphoribosylanthranilate isomerase
MAGGVAVKICGITRPEDAAAAVRLGADFLGLVFASSPRRVSLGQARAVLEECRGQVPVVGVFRDQPLEMVQDTARSLSLKWIQLHGQESLAYALALASEFTVIKAFDRCDSETLNEIESCPLPHVLLDRPKNGGAGWDFSAASAVANKKLFLAGGLTMENVADAVQNVHPFAVDVARGVEISPGIKDPELMKIFIRRAKGSD